MHAEDLQTPSYLQARSQEQVGQSFGAGCSPRKIAAWRWANSAKEVGRIPKTSGITGETCASLPFLRSANNSARASAMYGGIPAASCARFASSGGTLTYRICFPVAVESLSATSAMLSDSGPVSGYTLPSCPE